MSDVSNSQYLAFRGNTWHYQRRVPKHLLAVYGKAFVKQSLGVSDKKSAIKLRNALTAKIDPEFAEAERQLSASDRATARRSISFEGLVGTLRRFIAEMDAQGERAALDDPPADEGEKGDLRREIEIALQVLRTREDPNGQIWIEKTARHILDSAGGEPTVRFQFQAQRMI